MKKLIVLFCLLAASAIKAQAPQYLNYQGIARDAGGTIITTAIGVKFEILQGSASGTVVYDETNTITPSSAGIFTTAIGSGISGIGTFSLITWANGPYYIRVNIDPAGGTSYSTVGTSQLLSVPYALYAEKAGNTQTVNITGPNVTGTYPNYTITAPGALTASTGISIVGGTITNTAPNTTLTPTGITSITGTHPSFTIDVPPPALNYNTGTNVLTLTQGTAVATTTLVGAGSSTVSMFASGIASVTPVGAGNNFTVSVQSPSFTSVGATSVTGTYPNFVINSPGASTTIPTSLQINPPHTASTLSANNFSITVAPTNITGAGVTGSYPNYTITSAAQTSVASGGANVVVNGTAPSYTISAATPTIQINSPNTVTSLGLNNYSITVQPSSVGLTGVGVASVSGSSPNYTVTVPGPSLTVTGNSITVTQGTVVSTKTIATSPWTYSTGVIYSNGSVINDKVAIGQNSAFSNLDVLNAAGSSNSVNPVVAITNVNTSFNATGVLTVRNNSGNGAAIMADNATAGGDGIAINLSNVSNGGNALQVNTSGVGNAGYFAINSSSSNAKVLDLSNSGTGSIIYAVNTNTLNSSDALFIGTSGTGSAANFNKNGSGFGVSVNHNGTGGTAGFFNISNASNSSQAVTAQTSGNGEAIAAYNTGSGRAIYATNTGSIDAAYITNSGNGRALNATNTGSVDAAFFQNLGTGRGMYATNNSAAETGYFVNTGPGRSLVASNSTTVETALFSNSANGRGVVIQNSGVANVRAAQINGGLDVMGKTAGASSFAVIVTNNLSTNLFNIRDDGHVGIGNPSPSNRLNVLEGTAITAMQVQNSNATGGGAARFDISSNTNSADAVFIQNVGTGASIHASNGPTVGSALSLWVENGHIKSTSTAPPTSFSVTVSGGFTTPGFAPTCVGTDVKGVISFSTSATGFAGVNSFDIQYNFQKAYSVAPTVILTPKSDFKGLSFMVLSSSTSNFVVRIYRPNGATFPATIGSTFFDFNYFIIE